MCVNTERHRSETSFSLLMQRVLCARVRLASRLRAAVDGGAFVPLPFLRAADAAPAALLADIRLPHAHGGLHGALPLVRHACVLHARAAAKQPFDGFGRTDSNKYEPG